MLDFRILRCSKGSLHQCESNAACPIKLGGQFLETTWRMGGGTEAPRHKLSLLEPAKNRVKGNRPSPSLFQEAKSLFSHRNFLSHYQNGRDSANIR